MKAFRTLALPLVFLLAGSALSGPPSSKSNAPVAPPEEPPDSPKEETEGDPVGCEDGSVFEAVEDLRVECPDIDLTFRRAYGSWSSRIGSLGLGWAHGYEWRIVDKGNEVSVYSAGETGASDTVHRFLISDSTGTSYNADGYRLDRFQDGTHFVVTPWAVTYAFDADGRLSSLSAWNGTTVRLERDPESGFIERAVHDCGKSLEFEHDEDGFLTRVSSPDATVFVEFFRADHGVWPALGEVVLHDHGAVSTNCYRYADFPAPGTKSALASFARHSLSYGSLKPSESIRIPPRTQFDAEGEVAQNHGTDRKSGLVPRPILSKKTDSNGMSSRFEYIRPSEAPNALCEHVEMDGGLFETTLSFGDKTTEVRKPMAWGTSKTTIRFDDNGREISRTTGCETLSRTYDAFGNVARKRLQNGQNGAFFETLSSYDEKHRVTFIGRGYGASPTGFLAMEWDDRINVPSRVVSPEGRIREWTMDGRTIVIHGAGTNDQRLVTNVFLDDNLRPVRFAAPNGCLTEIVRDDSGYVTNIAPSQLPTMSVGYDILGHVSLVTLPGPHGTERMVSSENNRLGRPLRFVNPDGTVESFTYNGTGRRVTSHVDALGREEVFDWVLGFPIHAARVVSGTTNTLFGVEYDKQLNVVSISDPLGRNAETYVLDENARVVAITNLEGQVMTREHEVGDFVSSERRFDGSQVSYGYNAGGNLIAVEFPHSILAYDYDGDGLLLSASNECGLVSNEYDPATGWLSNSRGADGSRVAYRRNADGSLASLESVAGTVFFEYDEAGRRTRVGSGEESFRFGYCDWNGLLCSVTNEHGLVVEYGYDVMDRVTNLVWRTEGGDALGGFSYEYDAVGRIVLRRHRLANVAFDRNYSYDDFDRLSMDGETSYEYDAAGNRMARIDGANRISYVRGMGDWLASWTGGGYSYDDAGCVTQIRREGEPTLDLVWNDRYQLVSVSTNGIFAEGYTYDALGRRVSTTNTDGTMRHVYDDNWQCIADVDELGNVVVSYVWGEGIDKLLAVAIGGESYYPLTDIQGTVWGYVDSANNVVARWQYDAWGNVLDEFVSVPALATLRYRFQGREWSVASGLINFRHRWYDPETGRWLSKDVISIKGGINLYEFCNNDPLLFSDSFGMCPEESPKKPGIVHNNSPFPLLAKPEEGISPIVVKPYTAADVDGFSIPDVCPDKVFKLPDGTTVNVDAKGNVTVPSPLDVPIVFLGGGWKDNAWNENLKNPSSFRRHVLGKGPDFGWDALFSKRPSR